MTTKVLNHLTMNRILYHLFHMQHLIIITNHLFLLTINNKNFPKDRCFFHSNAFFIGGNMKVLHAFIHARPPAVTHFNVPFNYVMIKQSRESSNDFLIVTNKWKNKDSEIGITWISMNQSSAVSNKYIIFEKFCKRGGFFLFSAIDAHIVYLQRKN